MPPATPLQPSDAGQATSLVSTWISALLLALMAIALAACGNDPETPTPQPTPTQPPPTPTTQVGTAEPRPSPTPTPTPPARTGGVLRVGVPVGTPHFDVHQIASSPVAAWGVGLIYSRLFRYTDDPIGLVECELCERWEFVDGDTLRVTLRPDIRWQDREPLGGRPLTAADVVFSYARQKTPAFPNSALLRSVASMNAPDDRTVELKLSRFDSDLLLNLADGRSRIVAAESVPSDGNPTAWPNVGSGPWQVANISDDLSLYTRNETYFESPAPYLDRLEVSTIQDVASRQTAFRVGLLDVVDATASEAERLRENLPDITHATVTWPGTGVEIGLNTAVPPLDSLEVRQAIFLALDPERDLREVWNGDAMLSVGLPVPHHAWLIPQEDILKSFGNVDTVRRLIEDSGRDVSGSIEVVVGQWGEAYLEQARRVADALASLGFDVTVTPVTTRRFADEVWTGGRYEVFVGAKAPIDGLNDALLAVYHSDGAWNTTGYHTPELDALIERQAETRDVFERRRILREIQEETLAGAHRFTTAARVTHWLSQPWVEGFHPNPARGENFYLSRVTVGTRR